jgi:hypothetical protein
LKSECFGQSTDLDKQSGVCIEEVEPKYPDWAGNFRERLKAIGKESLYLVLQRIPSHAVHGSWVDILLHHVEGDEAGATFEPHSDWSPVDARLLTPIAYLILEAVAAYLEAFFRNCSEYGPIAARSYDLQARIKRFEELHEVVAFEAENPFPNREG